MRIAPSKLLFHASSVLCLALTVLGLGVLLRAQAPRPQDRHLHPLRIVPQSAFTVDPTPSNRLPAVVVVYDVETNFAPDGSRVAPRNQRFFYLPPVAFIRDATTGRVTAEINGRTVLLRLRVDVAHCPEVLAAHVSRLLGYEGDQKLTAAQFHRVEPSFFRIVTDERYLPRLTLYQFPDSQSQVLDTTNHTLTLPAGELPCRLDAPTAQLATQFVDDLNAGRVALQCMYGFPGYTHRLNSLTIQVADLRNTSTYKRLLGSGALGRVSRREVSQIAREAVASKVVTVRTEYEDPDFSALVERLVSDVSRERVELQNGWEELDRKFTELGWDPESFKADLITRSELEQNQELRNSFREKIETVSRRSGGGFNLSLFGASIFGAETPGEDESRFARDVTKDVLRKWGISYKLEGRRIIPKSVDVYVDADTKWGSTGHYTLNTIRPFSTTGGKTVLIDPAQNVVNMDPRATLQEQLANLSGQVEDLRELLARETAARQHQVQLQGRDITELRQADALLRRDLSDSIRFYLRKVGDNSRDGFDTGLRADQWHVGVIGFWARDGDIQENDSGDIMYIWPYVRNGKWWIRSDIRSHKNNEEWTVRYIAIRRGLLSLTYEGSGLHDGR